MLTLREIVCHLHHHVHGKNTPRNTPLMRFFRFIGNLLAVSGAQFGQVRLLEDSVIIRFE